MGRVRTQVRLPARAGEAEALWYDTSRWPTFVDGFARVVSVEAGWPREGTLTWDSRPGGRGRVLERVTGHAAGDGQRSDVEDDKLTGHQRVRFRQDGEEVVVGLELDYELKRRPPGWQVVDLLFIRRAQRDSLTRTLQRFAIELSAERELNP
jgi:hypothetical protein